LLVCGSSNDPWSKDEDELGFFPNFMPPLIPGNQLLGLNSFLTKARDCLSVARPFCSRSSHVIQLLWEEATVAVSQVSSEALEEDTL